jgi:hypothetical protein
MHSIATIEFDEIGFKLGNGATVGFFYGSADIDKSGSVLSMKVRTYDHSTRTEGVTEAHPGSAGIARLLFFGLAPVIKSQCATQITEAVLAHRFTEDDRAADYARETMEAAA